VLCEAWIDRVRCSLSTISTACTSLKSSVPTIGLERTFLVQTLQMRRTRALLVLGKFVVAKPVAHLQSMCLLIFKAVEHGMRRVSV